MGDPRRENRGFVCYIGGIHQKTKRGFASIMMNDGSLLGYYPDLPPRPDLHDYGPFNFDWWDGGDGTLQLSLALLADWLGDDERALRLHADFAREARIMRLTRYQNWTLDEDEIKWAVRRAEAFVADHGPWQEEP